MTLKLSMVLKNTAYLFSILLFSGCGTASKIISTPIENIDSSPLKASKLTEGQRKVWSHLDIAADTIPGVSLDRAYKELSLIHI